MNLVKQDDFKAVEQRMIELMPKETLKREISFAMQAINNSKQLQECSKESLQKAVYNVALTNLSLNPVLKYAYLIPRWSKNGSQAVLEPSYQGLIKLLTDTGSIVAVSANIVYEGDEFEVSYGTQAEIIHKPKFKSKDVQCVYAVAVLKGENFRQFEVMTLEEVNNIMEKSESYKAFKGGKITSCIWVDHWGEMAKKTVIKRLFKYLPKTDKFEHAAQAISALDEDYIISDNQIDYLVHLLQNAGYDDDTKAEYERQINYGLTGIEFNQLKREFEMNQVDRINSGANYNQSDITRKIAKEIINP
jgi:recombination protein RecT